MTRNELKQIYYLNNEIRMWKKELEKICNVSLIKSPIISLTPSSTKNNNDMVSDLSTKITDLELIIKDKLREIELQKEKTITYISKIDDSLIRQIIYYRDVKLMSWNQVAQKIGGGNTADSVRKLHSRFLKEK